VIPGACCTIRASLDVVTVVRDHPPVRVASAVGVRSTLHLVNALEFLAGLAGLEGSRESGSVANGISGARLLNGVEYAAAARADDRGLRLLGLEGRVRAKIRAASGVYGMESAVIEGMETDALRSFAGRLAGGDPTLLDDAEDASGAFIGEELRRVIARAAAEGEIDRVMRLPWGIGACFRQTASRRVAGAPGVFFACRTPPMQDADDGYRYWRYVELFDEETLVANDLEMLRQNRSGGNGGRRG